MIDKMESLEMDENILHRKELPLMTTVLQDLINDD